MMWNFLTYMKAIAVSLKDIQHTPSTHRFFRASNLVELEELLQGLVTAPSDRPVMVVIDAYEGTIGDQSTDNYLDVQLYSFYILKKVEISDMGDREGVLAACKATARKIISRMIKDKEYDATGRIPATGMKNLDTSNIAYMTVGPLADNFHGIEVMFSITQEPHITYDSDDWTV